MGSLLDLETERRVLYLAPCGPMTVRKEGPALAVASPGRAPRYYPVRRLCRVISRPRVDWQGAAIRLLMDEAVPLLFVDEDGRAAGLCLGGRAKAEGLSAHIESAFAAPSWPEGWRDWYRAEERRILFHLATALSWPTSDLRPALMRARVERALGEALGPSWPRVLRPLLAYARAQAAEALATAGIDPAVLGGLRGGVSLVDDIAVLLGWTLHGRVIAAPPEGEIAPRPLAAYYALFLAPRLAPSLRRLIARLWRLRLA